LPEKGEGKAGFVSDPTESLVDDLLGLADSVRAEVCQFATLEITGALHI